MFPMNSDGWNATTKLVASDVGVIGLNTTGMVPAPQAFARLYDDSFLRLSSYIGTNAMSVAGWGWGSFFPSTSCNLTRLVPRMTVLSRNTVGNTMVRGFQDRGGTVCDGDSGGPWWDMFGSRQITYALTHGNEALPGQVRPCGGLCGVAGMSALGPTLQPHLAWIVTAAAGAGVPVTSTRFSITGRDGQTYSYRRFDPQ